MSKQEGLLSISGPTPEAVREIRDGIVSILAAALPHNSPKVAVSALTTFRTVGSHTTNVMNSSFVGSRGYGIDAAMPDSYVPSEEI